MKKKKDNTSIGKIFFKRFKSNNVNVLNFCINFLTLLIEYERKPSICYHKIYAQNIKIKVCANLQHPSTSEKEVLTANK